MARDLFIEENVLSTSLTIESRKKELAGFLCINKPKDFSSFQIVKRVRVLSSVEKVGHAGTLDPFASGLLVVALSRRYTRQISKIQILPKIYRGIMLLGKQTNTLDTEGEVIKIKPCTYSKEILEEKIEEVRSSFLGKILQIPPQFSAKKVNGERAYLSARKNEFVDLAPCNVEIFSFDIIDIKMSEFPLVSFVVSCSKGTYIRSLSRDFGSKLGMCGYLTELSRDSIGLYSLSKAVAYEDLSYESIQKALLKEVLY